MAAYYNEHDAKAAAWLRELIKRNLIAPGDVDERSIEDVRPDDLVGYRQCHFFAGIGVWSYALRCAGWPDDREVWTGSCPCPPFSAAGKKKACPSCGGTNHVPHVGRTGFFVCCLCGHEWFADGRHLWPEMWRLLRDGRPTAFYGEQVASADGRTWFATVRASLEILGYAVGGGDLCAAGFGAPHIRQRLFFVADAASEQYYSRRIAAESDESGKVIRPARFCSDGVMGDAISARLEGYGRDVNDSSQPGWLNQESSRSTAAPGSIGALADASDGFIQEPGGGSEKRNGIGPAGTDDSSAVYATNGFWRDSDWIACRDGKWRSVEPGTFPLAHGPAERVGRLRGYGNAVVAQVAEEFIRAVM